MPPKRKAATTTSKASTKSTAKMGAKVTTPAPAGQSANTARRSARNNQSNASVTYSPPPQAVESSPKRVKTTRARTERKTDSREVFSPMRCAAWFEEYKDPEDHLQRIGPEGFERWLNDLGLQIDSPYMILLSWKLNAATMGYFTKDEWMGGFAKWEVDSNDILKTKIGSLYESLNSPESFKELYKYTFSFSKEGNQKCVQVEIAIEMWRQLFDNRYPHVKLFLEFLTEKQPVKVINKDQWNSLLEFVSTVSENFEDYDENSAWPVLFDEYVEWRKAKMEE